MATCIVYTEVSMHKGHTVFYYSELLTLLLQTLEERQKMLKQEKEDTEAR